MLRARSDPTMVDKSDANDHGPAGQESLPTGATQRQSSGHRAPDMRDTMAELTERAQLISREAGSKVAMAMKDVIAAAAGLAGFAVESARDLVQYMVRRGQMSQEEADRLIREAEEAHAKRPESERARPSASKIAAERAATAKAEALARAAAAASSNPAPASRLVHVASQHVEPVAAVRSKGTSHSTGKSSSPARASAAKRPAASPAAASAKPKKKASAASAAKGKKTKAPAKHGATKKKR